MSTHAVKRAAYSPPAERMRLYRKRRREGMQLVRIPLHVTEIDELVCLGLLQEEQRQNPEALRAVVLDLIHGMLDEIRSVSPHLRARSL
jgi:hypothetical protein